MENRQLLCCTARLWCLAIGWLQILFSTFWIVFLIFYNISFALGFYSNTLRDNGDHSTSLIMASMLSSIIALFICLFAGIMLIVGVKQRNAQKLTFWMKLQFIFILFSIYSIVMGLISGGNFMDLVREIVTIILSFVAMWIVNLYREGFP